MHTKATTTRITGTSMAYPCLRPAQARLLRFAITLVPEPPGHQHQEQEYRHGRVHQRTQ